MIRAFVGRPFYVWPGGKGEGDDDDNPPEKLEIIVGIGVCFSHLVLSILMWVAKTNKKWGNWQIRDRK